MAVSPKVARPTRTFTQVGAAAVVVQAAVEFGAELTPGQYGILVVVLGPVLGFLQVLFEDRTGYAFLRTLPAPDVPLVETPPTP